MTDSKTNLIHDNTKKMYRYFLTILCANVAFEFIMTVRGLIFFNLSRPKHLLYFSSYIFLLVTSLIALIALMIWNKEKRDSKMLIIGTYLYTACLFAWSAFVSAIDYVAKGDSGIMVFVMISMAVAVLVRINPTSFIIMMGIGTILMIVAICLNIGFAFSTGFLTNIGIFLLLSWFISLLCYKRGQKELKTERQLTLFSVTDQLTGIYNRRKLDSYIAELTEENKNFVFILMDIDDFKMINDTHGHTVGDDCLVIVASKLGEHFGEHVFRFGGDEFAVIADMSCDEARALMSNIESELIAFSADVELHISAGLYAVVEKTNPRDIFVYADRALYEAKKNGKSQSVVYNK